MNHDADEPAAGVLHYPNVVYHPTGWIQIQRVGLEGSNGMGSVGKGARDTRDTLVKL